MNQVVNRNNQATTQPTFSGSQIISVKEAKKVLGTTANGLSDDAIRRLVAQVDVLTDIIVAQASDSKINASIDISKAKVHTNE